MENEFAELISKKETSQVLPVTHAHACARVVKHRRDGIVQRYAKGKGSTGFFPDKDL